MPVKYLLFIFIAIEIIYWGLFITTNQYQKMIEADTEYQFNACVAISISWFFYLFILTLRKM